jgi:hypothetical protein
MRAVMDQAGLQSDAHSICFALPVESVAGLRSVLAEAEAEAEAENDILVDYSQFVEIDEEIDVRVLMPWGDIQNEKLIVYTLNIPDDDDE